MTVKTNKAQPETTIEESEPELTPFQHNILYLNELRKGLRDIQYDREEFIYFLNNDPKLTSDLEILIRRVKEMKAIISEARKADY